jgi:phage pi2 protein 07
LNRADAVFAVARDGRKYGTLHVSNGAVVWFPRDTSYGYKISWQKLHELMEKHARRFEKR